MSETTAPQSQESAKFTIDPSVRKALPDTSTFGGGDFLKQTVGAHERQFDLQRFKTSERTGIVGGTEDILRRIGNELGLGQDTRELGILKKMLKEKGAQELFQSIVGKEMTGKSAEDQADFMSAGMASVKEVVLDLIDVQSKASELNSKVVSEALSNLWKSFAEGSESDRKAIRAFLSESKKARKESWDTMLQMWDVQEDLDSVHKVKEITDIGEDIPEDDEYDFNMNGGVIRKIASFIRRLPGGAVKRVGAPFERSGKRAKHEVQDRLAQLRSRARVLGSDVEDVQMWAQGMISRKELGGVNLSVADLTKAGINEEQVTAFTKNEELAEFSRNGKFLRASESKQIAFLEKFLANRVTKAEESFNQARNRYLDFDVKNANNWDKALAVAAVPVDVILPKWFKSAVAESLVTAGDGVLSLTEGVGGGIGFGIDRMEAVIAQSALEDLSSSAVARQMAVEKLTEAMASEDVAEKDLVEAAAALRGAETALARAALLAGRADDTVSLAEGKNLAVSALAAPIEMGISLIDNVTGGVLVGEKTQKVFAEIFSRTKKLLDGDGVIKSVSAELMLSRSKDSLAQSAASEERAWFDSKIAQAGIPAEYANDKSMEYFISNKLFAGKLVESFRQLVGPEMSKSQLWRVIAGGSKRQSVEAVKTNTADRRSLSTMAIEFAKGNLADRVGAEKADTAVQEATLITLRDSQRRFAESELKQISTRAKLDKMWSNVFALGAGAAAAAVSTLAFRGLEAVASSWVDAAGISFGKAASELQNMQDGLQKIVETAQQYDLPTAVSGAKSDIFWQNVQVYSAKVNLDVAQFTKDQAPVMKLISGATAAMLPILAASRAAFESLPFRAKLNTEFMNNEQVK